MKNTWREKARNISPYVPGEQPKSDNIIKLNANENPYPPSPLVQEAIKRFHANGLNRYPNASAQPLRQVLADYHHVQESQVFIGNGSDDVLALAFQAFFASGQPILFPEITYSFYPVWCSLFQIPYKTIPLDQEFHTPLAGFQQENGGIVLPNPNAPTGISETRDFLISLLDKNQNSVVILDEAYVDFGGHSAIDLINTYENLLVVHTFSKSRSLAGLRIGVAYGSDALLSILDAVKNSYNSYTVDSVAMAAAIASVQDDAYFQQTVKKIVATRDRTAAALASLGFTVCPSHSNFLFVTHPTADAKALFSFLRDRNLYIRYFSLPGIENYLRITIGTDAQMDILLAEITDFLS